MSYITPFGPLAVAYIEPARPGLSFAAASNKSQCTHQKGLHRAEIQFCYEKQIQPWDFPPTPPVCAGRPH